ncbi:U-box domain-containing protein 8 [Glycine max]|nr:U-box domain-containing protein 8 [Glycine max]
MPNSRVSRPHKSITCFCNELDAVLGCRFLALPRVFVGGIYVGALVPALLTCLQHISAANLRHRALSLLLHLSLDDDTKVSLVAEGLLSPAAPSDCHALAATLLTSLVVFQVNKATIEAFPGSIHALVTLLCNGKGRERKEAATTLYALCSFPHNQHKAVECGTVPVLLRSANS